MLLFLLSQNPYGKGLAGGSHRGAFHGAHSSMYVATYPTLLRSSPIHNYDTFFLD